MENWKIVESCPNYSISSLGQVRNNKTGRILKNQSATNLYLFVGICGKTTYIHQLVTHHFIGKRPKDRVVDHIDGNRFNNNISNLRYISLSENVSSKHMSQGPHIMTVRIPSKIWLKLRRLYEERKIKSIQNALIKGLEMVIEKVK